MYRKVSTQRAFEKENIDGSQSGSRKKDSDMRGTLSTISQGFRRPKTAYKKHQARLSQPSDKLAQVRDFGLQVTNTEVHNGIHPGKPHIGQGANELRFDLLINDLMP
jgi:hypothetical protein